MKEKMNRFIQAFKMNGAVKKRTLTVGIPALVVVALAIVLLSFLGMTVLDLSLLVPGPAQAIAMSQRFREDPAGFYHSIIGLLTQPDQK